MIAFISVFIKLNHASSSSNGSHNKLISINTDSRNDIIKFFARSYFFTTFRNSSLSALHGLLVVSGLILYSIGSKNLPAAELTLLSLTEIIGGIFWVWLPIFGINEVPSANTIIGGVIITFAIFYYSIFTQRKRRFIGLN